MQPDETQPILDAYSLLQPTDGGCAWVDLRRDHITHLGPEETGERLAQGLCGLAFWAGQLQGENEKLVHAEAHASSREYLLREEQKRLEDEADQERRRAVFLENKLDDTHTHRCFKCDGTVTAETNARQEAMAATRSDAGPMGGAAQALLSHELQEATEALWAAREETDELRSRLRAHAEPSEELQVAREKAASLHAQVAELVERNTALEQEVCDLKMGALTHSSEAQDDAQQEAERWRLAAESLEQRLTKALAELAPYRALVDGFARELGEAMLKRALEVRT